MHVYSDPALERHVNDLSGVEVPRRYPAAAAGIEAAEAAGFSAAIRAALEAATAKARAMADAAKD